MVGRRPPVIALAAEERWGQGSRSALSSFVLQLLLAGRTLNIFLVRERACAARHDQRSIANDVQQAVDV